MCIYQKTQNGGFNPRPSCEGRPARKGMTPCFRLFQSAPLLRGATQRALKGILGPKFQSAPLLRGATRQKGNDAVFPFVSIRAPLARGDLCAIRRLRPSRRFNPRPSCEGRPRSGNTKQNENMFQSAPLLRGATGESFVESMQQNVSIRAPLARGDFPSLMDMRGGLCFNPRPSCEGRP